MAKVKRPSPIASRKRPRRPKRPRGSDGTDGGTVWLQMGPIWLRANNPKKGRRPRITVRGGKVTAAYAKTTRGRRVKR